MVDTFSAGGVVVNKYGQVAVVNQGGVSWSLPKGHIEENENPLTAAMREITEETGITQLAYVADLGTYQRLQLDDEKVQKNITMFLFTTEQMELKPRDSENPEACWINRDQVAQLLTHPKDKVYFVSILDKLEYV